MHEIKVRRVSETAAMPTRGTEHSACFDVYADLKNDVRIKVYTKRSDEYAMNYRTATVVRKLPGGVSDKCFILYPNDRALIPLNLIFDIPHGYSIKMYPRSGASFKHGLTLINSVGVIDSDYTDPCFVPVINLSDKKQFIHHGDRLAQIELSKVEPIKFVESDIVVKQKTNRTGGFGSTGA